MHSQRKLGESCEPRRSPPLPSPRDSARTGFVWIDFRVCLDTMLKLAQIYFTAMPLAFAAAIFFLPKEFLAA